MRTFTLAFFFVGLSVVAFSQETKCDSTKGYTLNAEMPGVFINFEQFGKATDWKQSRLGEWSDKSAIKNGDDVWLRLYNNSCWDITLRTDSLYLSKKTVDGKPKVIFGILEDGAIANVQYRIEEQDRRQVPFGAHGGNLSILPSGRSIIFGVMKDHLENDRSIYVDFTYGWEQKQFSNNLAPLHRAFFWGYRLEEVRH